MRYLHARLDQPEWMRHPMQRFLARSDAMERVELHAWNLSREDVQFALFYMVGDIDAYRERIDEVEPVREYELTPVDEEHFYSYVCQTYTDADEAFFDAFAALRLVVVPPLVYDGRGRLTLTSVGAGDALTELVATLRDSADIGVEVLEIGEYDRRHGTVAAGLTDRQFEAVETATSLGYYTTPREAALADVADELGIAEATASELLRRAESRVMERVVGT
ncbi:helix-turn-helix domain-containing protein [Haloglomus litoreum]|uniref:helix-turn-helix domain-containing protein n=1 Tax=Haloglomus litoreum TaxID=3034026 RepID=UPI0023E88810|nr:helix-turn-helix domain-containing protein [Haloglomus sp. DT116]